MASANRSTCSLPAWFRLQLPEQGWLSPYEPLLLRAVAAVRHHQKVGDLRRHPWLIPQVISRLQEQISGELPLRMAKATTADRERILQRFAEWRAEARRAIEEAVA